MKKLSFILLFFVTQISIGQSNLKELNDYVKKIENVSELSNLKNVNFKSLSIITVQIDIERDIDFGYKHHRFNVIPVEGYELKLNVISKNDSIQIAWISEFASSKHKKIMTVIKNPDFINWYVKNHNILYHTKLTTKDFTQQILKEYVVGFGCGISGDYIPKKSKKMLKLVKYKNIKKLQDYLTSFSPELQALGAIGLLKIGKLSPMQNNIIEHLKKKNSVISTCAGCLFGINIKFMEVIKNNNE